MYVVKFAPLRVIEFSNLKEFLGRARVWLNQREGENTYLIGTLSSLDPERDPAVRMFTVEQNDAIVAAGLLASGGSLHLTWAAPEVVTAVIEHAIAKGWNVTGTSAPAHISRELAQAMARHSQRCAQLLRAERVFQLTHISHALPLDGRLEVAHPGDKPLVSRWFAAFVEESRFLGDVVQDPRAVDWLIDPRRLYLWKSPEPVAMAAWVAPSMNGGCMNYVYVPPEHRRRGYGKAIVAALGGQMLASGLRYCFILADAADSRTNHLYQSVGASSVTDLHHFTLSPRRPAPKSSRSGGSHCPAVSGT